MPKICANDFMRKATTVHNVGKIRTKTRETFMQSCYYRVFLQKRPATLPFFISKPIGTLKSSFLKEEKVKRKWKLCVCIILILYSAINPNITFDTLPQ